LGKESERVKMEEGVKKQGGFLRPPINASGRGKGSEGGVMIQRPISFTGF
jgi:hypothetical protein